MERFDPINKEQTEKRESPHDTSLRLLKEERLKWFTSSVRDEANTAIVEWFNKIKEKYPDPREYILVHALIGSTPAEGVTKFDLPGEDSVLLFAKSLTEALRLP